VGSESAFFATVEIRRLILQINSRANPPTLEMTIHFPTVDQLKLLPAK
jgi:hypothetical protein